MIKNKLIKTSLCALSLLSVFNTPVVYAEDGQSDTEQIMPADIITQDLKTVTLNYEVAETYEWNIHPAIDFGKNAGVNQTVSKKNNTVSVTKNVLRSGNKLVIKIKGGGNNNAFTISNGKNQVLDYVVNDGVNNLGADDTILEIASGVSSSRKNLEFKLSTSKNNAEIAGSYNGTVSYTAELNGPVLINKTDRYVNFYADVDGNGTVDGVIFKDLANGASQEAISRMKNYTISEETYNGKFGTLPVITPADTGEDRFYVMALENITGPNDFSLGMQAIILMDIRIMAFLTT